MADLHRWHDRQIALSHDPMVRLWHHLGYAQPLVTSLSFHDAQASGGIGSGGGLTARPSLNGARHQGYFSLLLSRGQHKMGANEALQGGRWASHLNFIMERLARLVVWRHHLCLVLVRLLRYIPGSAASLCRHHRGTKASAPSAVSRPDSAQYPRLQLLVHQWHRAIAYQPLPLRSQFKQSDMGRFCQ
ncbi:hypothetical protein D3C77_436850 [compost metagenome]